MNSVLDYIYIDVYSGIQVEIYKNLHKLIGWSIVWNFHKPILTAKCLEYFFPNVNLMTGYLYQSNTILHEIILLYITLDIQTKMLKTAHRMTFNFDSNFFIIKHTFLYWKLSVLHPCYLLQKKSKLTDFKYSWEWANN